ncbi:MAG: alpha/beta hydrolase [Alteromonas stellipolaris]|uniref:alpha/beta hydrolase n=1 Tax=Alteromonas stellipolaris TaxID=233316 RepID=UPI003B8D1B4C
MLISHWKRITAITLLGTFLQVSAQAKVKIEEKGTVHVPGFVLPESSFLNDETRGALKKVRQLPSVPERKACPPIDKAEIAEIAAIRDCRAAAFYQRPDYKLMTETYNVHIESTAIAGVPVEIFTPKSGISDANKNRVLINLHSGAYLRGSRTASHMDSIPIAATGHIKVISIDYRLGPEFRFPAASEDVAAVYGALLRDYSPDTIGIYGSSGGAMLLAQSIAWFLEHKLPMPGAVGMFGSGAPTALEEERYKWLQSDSAYIFDAIHGTNIDDLYGPPHAYFKGIDRRERLSSPGSFDDIMERFPPTLLMNGGLRDFSLSMVLVTHAQLTRLGVDAELHAWEGMPHVFHLNPMYPEAKEAYSVATNFFNRHLAK